MVSHMVESATFSREKRLLSTSFDVLRQGYRAAICSAFGPNVAGSVCVGQFFDRRFRIFLQRPDTSIAEIKLWLNRIISEVFSGKVSRKTLGQLLPRKLSNCRKAVKLLQFCKWRRALPLPATVSSLDKSREQYWQIVSTPGVSTTRSLNIVRQVARHIALVLPLPKLTPFHFAGASAALGFPRKAGGRAAYLEPFRRISRDTAYPPVRNRKILSALTRVDRLNAEIFLSAERSDDSRQTFIREYGWKYRIVTANDPSTVAESHAWREVLFAYLLDVGVTMSEPLKDPNLERIDFGIYRSPDRILYSADLSAATEWLNRDAIDLFCSQIGIDPCCVYGLKVDGKPVYRGTFMGLPCSWAILSIIHDAVCAVVDPKHAYRIKGDDLVAYWTTVQWSYYLRLMSELGFVVNTTKSFGSRKYATFCEADYVLHGFRAVLHRMDTFSLRTFVKKEVPNFNFWGRFRHNKRVLCSIRSLSRTLCRSVIIKYTTRKIDPCLDVSLGGLSLVPSDLDKLLSPGNSILVQRIHNGVGARHRCLPPDSEGGNCIQDYMDAASEAVWTSQPLDEDFTVLYENILRYVLPRAFFLDSLHGFSITREKNTMREHRQRFSFYKKNFGRGGIPHPTSYRNMYDILSRAKVRELGPLSRTHVNLTVSSGLAKLQGLPEASKLVRNNRLVNSWRDPTVALPGAYPG